MSDSELVNRSLELFAQKDTNVVPAVYAEFYRRCPAAEALFAHYSQLVYGRMFNELIATVVDLADEKHYIENFFEIMVITHNAYGVTAEMYGHFMQAALDVLRQECGCEWTPDMSAAWQRQFDVMLTLVTRRAIKTFP